MAKAFSVVYLVYTFLGISRVTAMELRFTSEPPELSLQESVHKINASETLEITCRGPQLLEWVTPFNRSHVEGRLTLSDCSGAGLFCSTLVLTAATANETGLFRCSFKNQPAEDGKTSASIYVFVQDYRSPFVRSTHPYDVVFIREGEQVVIPCLGSVEDINVTLFMELTPDGKKVYWDSKRGFVLPSHLISFAGLVYCHTQIHNETFSSSLYLIAVVGYKIHDLLVTPWQERLSVGERLVLNCTARTELNVVLDYTWKFPQGQVQSTNTSMSRAKLQSHKKKLWNSLELSNTFIIDNVTMDDAGKYTCTASSGGMTKTSSVSVTVYEKPFIELSDQLLDTVEVFAKDGTARIPLKYTAYPEPTVRWFKNDQPIRKEDSYRIKPGRDYLTILDVVEKDAGNYTAVLTNRNTKEEHRHTFRLLVNVPPQIFEKEVAVHSDAHMYGSSPSLSCTSRGGLSPVNIRWQWMPKEDCPVLFERGVRPVNQLKCTQWRDVGNGTALNHVSRPSTFTDARLKTVSTLKIQKAEDHALYRCIATNRVGMDVYIIVFQVTRGLQLSLNSSEPIEQDNVALQCKADRLLYGNLTWYRVLNVSSSSGEAQAFPASQPCRTLPRPLQHLPQTAPLRVQGSNITLELLLTNTSQQDEGLYVCQVESLTSPFEKTCLLHYLSLRALESAKITSVLTDQRVNVSDSITMTCEVIGTPTPTIIWMKNNQTVGEESGVLLKRSNSTLTILRVKKDDSGLYVCTACNSQGCDVDQAFLSVEGAEEKMNVELIVPIGAVVIAIFFWILIVFVIRSRKRPNDGELKTGYLSMILDDDDMPMDEHCERLTYDASKWEFPRDRLKLGEPLGRGAFGQVVEASAFGIEKATTCTTVAVKMLKEGATASEYQALMSELKILIHIGHHLNVVNLLGACTKPGGPLMVIVEYCKHGNLSSYLKSKREEYSPFKRRGLSPWHSRAQVEDDFSQGDLGLGTSARLDICTGTASCSREDWAESCLEEQESDWDHLALEDLISYSFQVAKGMDFLSSRKCIHRDLAARNILLSENNVVKICDFGLARDVYKDPDYVRKGDARLPLKWMAPETIFDRVYTTQSDVWSFGVLLWEIFSLGASPYPGVAIDESFCRRLKEGTRMRAPDYATPEIYQTMLDCWLDRPTDRPTFTELVEHLGNLLQASAHQDGKDYIPLTSGDQEGIIASSHPRGGLSRSPREDSTAVQLHYDNAPTLGYPLQGDGQGIFENISLRHSLVRDVEIERAMGLSAEEMKRLDHHSHPHGTSRTHLFSPILRCKSKESLASESSNQTSGYQSGYHSDDAEAPIYANEEMILRRDGMKRPLPKTAEKFTVDVRYSAPPV